MTSFSMWHWLIILAIVFGYIIPLWRILSRIGFPGALSLLFAVPLINIIVLWTVAFTKWPVENSKKT